MRKWNIQCNNKIKNSKVGNFTKSTITNSPTGHAEAISLPPIGNGFMYIESSGNNNSRDDIFVSFERTDIIQIIKNTFFYNRSSIFINDSKRSMGRLRIQLLLEDNTWSTQYTIPKNSQYSNSSTD